MERTCDTCGSKAAHFYDTYCKQCGLKLHSRGREQHSSPSTPERNNSSTPPPLLSGAGIKGALLGRRDKVEDKDKDKEATPLSTAGQQQKIRLSVTVHSIAGLRYRQASHRAIKLYWSLRLLSADGAKSQRATTAMVAVDPNNPLVTFEESFDFILEFEGQVLELKGTSLCMVCMCADLRNSTCFLSLLFSHPRGRSSSTTRQLTVPFKVRLHVCEL